MKALLYLRIIVVVPLSGITAVLIRAALDSASVLQASIRGTGKDGGPSCATIPLLSDWAVVATD
jgi:hypothetical protein